MKHWALVTLNCICEIVYQLGSTEAGKTEFAESGELSRAVVREFVGGEDGAPQLPSSA